MLDNSEIERRLEGIHPNAVIRPASEIDSKWKGVSLSIDWLLIVITQKGHNGSSYIQVDSMAIEYPFDPLTHRFKNMSYVVKAIRNEIELLEL